MEYSEIIFIFDYQNQSEMKNSVTEAHRLMHAERVEELSKIELNEVQQARLAEAGISVVNFANYYIADMHWVFKMNPNGYITGTGLNVLERGPETSLLEDGSTIATSEIKPYFEAQRFIWEGRESWKPRSESAYRRNRKDRESYLARFTRYQAKLDSLIG